MKDAARMKKVPAAVNVQAARRSGAPPLRRR
jgi:hypothetical protein